MTLKKLTLVIVSALLLGGLLMAGCKSQPGESVSFETVEQGTYSGVVNPAGQPPFVWVAHEEAYWRDLWETHNGNQEPMPALPEIDFSRQMVIALFAGEKNTGGYALEITGVSRDDEALYISYRETSPEPDQLVTEALTQPFHIIKTEKIEDLPLVGRPVD